MRKFICIVQAGAISSSKQKEVSKLNIKTITTKSYVIGLLPFSDDEKSIELLFYRERFRKHFLDWDSDELLAKVRRNYLAVKDAILNNAHSVIYVGSKSVDEIVDEISEIVRKTL